VPDGRPDDEGKDLHYAWRALSVVSLASVATSLNSSALNTALPVVVQHFRASSAEASWILISFLLVNTVVQLLCGRAADFLGRRFMYLLGLSLFTGSSFLLGVAPNVVSLIGLRAVQAIAGAMLVTNSAAIVSAAFPSRLLAKGLGIYMASFSIASLVGPTLGGLLATHLGWRWVFWFNVPVGLLCLVWGAMTLRNVERTSAFEGLDVLGNVLLFAGLGGLILALSQAGSDGWSSPAVLTGGLFAVAFLPLFVVVERRSRAPVLELSLFKSRSFTMANLAGFINTIARGAVIIVAALYFIAVQGHSALRAGVELLPLSAANAVAAASLGGLTARMPARAVAVIGSAITSASLLWLMLACGAQSGFWTVSVGLVLVGLGSGVFMPANIAAIIEETPEDQVGIVNAIRLTVQSTGIVVGTAVALTVLTMPLEAALRQNVYAGTVSALGPHAVAQLATGYRWSFGAMFAVSLLGIVSSMASQRVARGPEAAR
jgi:EmrB/QacA subfamily drug resistance transporter